jgi:hypothetical protein
MLGNPWVAVQLAASQEGLSSMELVTFTTWAKLLTTKIRIITAWKPQSSPLCDGTWDVSSGDRNSLMASRWSYFRKRHYVPVCFETLVSCGAITRWRHRHALQRLWNVNSWHLDMTSPYLQICTETFVKFLSAIMKTLLFFCYSSFEKCACHV